MRNHVKSLKLAAALTLSMLPFGFTACENTRGDMKMIAVTGIKLNWPEEGPREKVEIYSPAEIEEMTPEERSGLSFSPTMNDGYATRRVFYEPNPNRPEILSLHVGDKHTLKASVYPPDATNKEVDWTSSNPDVATVEDGIVTVLDYGFTNIVATTRDGGKTATCRVGVSDIMYE
jgi:hypothetical protein